MLYLDYAKQTEDGYIMNFFANSVEDLEDISEGKEFVTKNGTNYGVPAPQSVVTITNKDGEKTTYLMGEDGNWIPGVVNPTDYYTKKQVDAKLEGKEDKITDINLTETGTTVTYDTTDGITLNSTARLTSNEETHDATMKLEVPLVVLSQAGSPLVMDKAADSEKVELRWNTDTFIYGKSIQLTGSLSLSSDEGEISYIANKEDRPLISLTFPEGAYRLLGPRTATYHKYVAVYLPSEEGVLATTNDIPIITAGDNISVRQDEGSPRVYISATGVMTTGNVKTLFGNQSIVGTGNIDLYRHTIEITTGDLDFGATTLIGNFYSSNNLKCTSIQDLTTVFGSDFALVFNGYVTKGTKVPTILGPCKYITPTNIHYWSDGEMAVSFSEINFTITDTVKAI